MFSIEDFRSYYKHQPLAVEQLLRIHKEYFYEGIYKDMTWSENKTRAWLMAILSDSDWDIAVAVRCACIVGFCAMAHTTRYQHETITIVDAFYISDGQRNGKCSQNLFDFFLDQCYSRDTKKIFVSSAAGFSDNGCNERAFRMLCKRNGFRDIGTSLVREL